MCSHLPSGFPRKRESRRGFGDFADRVPHWTDYAFGVQYTVRFGVLPPKYQGDEERRTFVVKLVIRDKESIQEAVRRFRKLIERSGLKKEMRRREHFEKPSEIKRRAKLRAIHRCKHLQRLATEGIK